MSRKVLNRRLIHDSGDRGRRKEKQNIQGQLGKKKDTATVPQQRRQLQLLWKMFGKITSPVAPKDQMSIITLFSFFLFYFFSFFISKLLPFAFLLILFFFPTPSSSSICQASRGTSCSHPTQFAATSLSRSLPRLPPTPPANVVLPTAKVERPEESERTKGPQWQR